MSKKQTMYEAIGRGIASGVRNTVAEVMTGKYWRAVKYITPHWIVRATLIGRNLDKRSKRINISLTIGKPNFKEREFIKPCQKAKEPFPVKRIQVQLAPKTKKNGKKK